MRRTPLVLTATVLGTAGVLLFKPLPSASLAAASTTGSSGTSSSTAPADSSGDSSSSTSSGGSASGSTGSGSTSSTSSGASTSTSSSAKDGTYTGAEETTRFGTTQVSVTIAAGKITEVATVQLNQDDQRSVQISENAAPILRSEVLTAQSAAVDTVSGATYTSLAYEASLQAALDTAGYTAPDGSTASTDVSNIQESGGGFGGH